jgi:hypothetical protein
MTDDAITLDTTIPDPGPSAGELELLLFSLDRSRATFAWKVGGLDDEALHRAHPPSGMSLAGLLKHLALVEDLKTADLFGWPEGAPWDRSAWDDDPDWEWTSAADDGAAELYALWQAAVARSRAAWTAAAAAGVRLDGPARVEWGSGGPPNLRRILIDLTDEYARHVGHADLFREAIDGRVGEDPPQG